MDYLEEWENREEEEEGEGEEGREERKHWERRAEILYALMEIGIISPEGIFLSSREIRKALEEIAEWYEFPFWEVYQVLKDHIEEFLWFFVEDIKEGGESGY